MLCFIKLSEQNEIKQSPYMIVEIYSSLSFM